MKNQQTAHKIANTNEIYWLGITIVIGGQLFGWNIGYHAGFLNFFVSMLFVTAGYMSLSLCLSEMTSILPFAGGAYGFARVTLGPLIGYLIGCCESIEFILYVAVSLDILAKMITVAFGGSTNLEPVYWLIYYLLAMCIQIYGGKVFWRCSNALGIISFLLIVVYCLSSIRDVNISTFSLVTAVDSLNARRQVEMFLEYMPLATWFFVGIECLPLACSDSVKPTEAIPKGLVAGCATLFFTGVALQFLTATQFPGVEGLKTADYPLNFGYQRTFGINSSQATILLLPATFATCFGFTFAYGRQMNAMAKSGLFPKIMSKTFGDNNTPHTALISGSLLGFMVLIVNFVSPNKFIHLLFNICILGSFFVYISMFLSFIIFRQKYTTLKRNFTNHLGIYSAYFGIFVFTVAFIAVAGFQQDGHNAVIGFFVLLALFLIYYALVANKRQFFSPEEQATLLVAYIINANAKAHKKLFVTKKDGNSHHHHGGGNHSTSNQNSSRSSIKNSVVNTLFGGSSSNRTPNKRVSMDATSTVISNSLGGDNSQNIVNYNGSLFSLISRSLIVMSSTSGSFLFAQTSQRDSTKQSLQQQQLQSSRDNNNNSNNNGNSSKMHDNMKQLFTAVDAVNANTKFKAKQRKFRYKSKDMMNANNNNSNSNDGTATAAITTTAMDGGMLLSSMLQSTNNNNSSSDIDIESQLHVIAQDSNNSINNNVSIFQLDESSISKRDDDSSINSNNNSDIENEQIVNNNSSNKLNTKRSNTLNTAATMSCKSNYYSTNSERELLNSTMPLNSSSSVARDNNGLMELRSIESDADDIPTNEENDNQLLPQQEQQQVQSDILSSLLKLKPNIASNTTNKHTNNSNKMHNANNVIRVSFHLRNNINNNIKSSNNNSNNSNNNSSSNNSRSYKSNKVIPILNGDIDDEYDVDAFGNNMASAGLSNNSNSNNRNGNNRKISNNQLEMRSQMVVNQMMLDLGRHCLDSRAILDVIENSNETDEIKYIAKKFHEQQQQLQKQHMMMSRNDIMTVEDV